MKYFLKINYLRNILIISSLISMLLPLCVILFIYPSFTAQLTKNTEDEAVRVGRHLMTMIIADQNELTNESLSTELLNKIQEIAEDFKLMKLKIFSKSGETIYSNSSKDIGVIHKNRYFHESVAKGKVYTKVVKKDTKSLEGQTVTADVVETYIPIIKNGTFIGAFEIYYNITSRKESLSKLLSTSSVALIILVTSLMSAIIVVLSKAGKNIFERERTEQALKDSEKRYRILFEKAGDAISILEAEGEEAGKIIAANQTAAEMHGYTLEELLTLNIKDLDTPDTARKAPGRIRRMLEGEWVKAEITHRRKDGTVFPVEMSAGGLELGNRNYILAFDRDIENRKQAEEALRESEKTYRLLVKNLTSVVYKGYKDWSIEFFDEKIELLTGYTANEFNSKKMKWVDIIIEEDIETVREIFIQALKTDKSYVREYRVKSKTGNVHWIEERGQIACDSNGEIEYVSGTFFDKTETKKLEAQLQQTQKLESVGILAGGIAHDFNNLLSIIMGNISMTKDDVKPEYGVSDFLNEAEKASLLARDLTKQLITFSKGGAPVKKISYISNLIEKATDFALSGSNIGCEFNTPDDLWPIEIDEGQIRHVINNVVTNAVQAMPEGGTIEVCAENLMSGSDKDYEELSLQDGKYVKISIQDQGIGISDKDLPMIFDPYYSSKERGTQKGMGLGLATSYSIIKQHNGEITAESKLGIGTTINIYLPASEIEVPVKKKLKEKAISGKGRILVMDDEEMVRNITGQMLNRLGYKVEFSKDGDEAVVYYRESMKSEKPFDTVILDLTVRGGMGGKEAIQKLIEIDPDVKGIVSSGHSEDPVMNDFGKYGFCSAIAKPYSMPELSVILDKVITDTAYSA